MPFVTISPGLMSRPCRLSEFYPSSWASELGTKTPGGWGGGVLLESLGGDVPLGPWNP